MTYLTNELTYGLYSDVAHANVMGSMIGTNTVSGTGLGTAQTTTVYGLIPANQFVVPGAYVDTITASIIY